MSITFTCEYCGKKIKSPDEAAGKWGKCPACHNRILVPQPGCEQEEEELKLAPIDEKEIAKQKQLLAETYKLAQEIMGEKQVPGEPADGAEKPGTEGDDDERLMTNIVTYLRYMADGELDQAGKIIKQITSAGERALKILNDIAYSAIPEPELADIPRQVLSGLIKALRAKIS
jgi:DNA-directed RNA polymerase subunit RPC12/RpoP